VDSRLYVPTLAPFASCTVSFGIGNFFFETGVD
jgi:hypothetical protein